MRLTRRYVGRTVQLVKPDATLEGVLVAVGQDAYVLRGAKHLVHTGEPIPLGEVIVPKPVSYFRVP